MPRTKLRACDEVALRMLQERMILSQILAISSRAPYARIVSIYGVLRILEVVPLSIINLYIMLEVKRFRSFIKEHSNLMRPSNTSKKKTKVSNYFHGNYFLFGICITLCKFFCAICAANVSIKLINIKLEKKKFPTFLTCLAHVLF